MAKPLLELRKDGICVDVHAWVLAESIIDRLFAVKLVGEVPLVVGTTEAPLPGAAEETNQSSSNELADQFGSETALRLAYSMDCDAKRTAQPDAQFQGQAIVCMDSASPAVPEREGATCEEFYIGSVCDEVDIMQRRAQRSWSRSAMTRRGWRWRWQRS